MENGSNNDATSSTTVDQPSINGDIEGMANFPDHENEATSATTKINGDLIKNHSDDDDKDSSDCDALIIDESVKPPKKKVKNTQQEPYTHTNPYFSQSIFELSTHYNAKTSKKGGKTGGRKLRGKSKPKLREYAQYLGLQPSVQFKCYKCSSSGFQSLQELNEHLTQCTSRPSSTPPPQQSNNMTNFRVTRKVFLCSACGTYYENWNLFLHMREVHKRFICLYCLGMFPLAEKLSLHLISKHNCVPSSFETVDDFFSVYKEPCFLMCCECQYVFNEQENFINHKCISDKDHSNTTNSERVDNEKCDLALSEPVPIPTTTTTTATTPEATTASASQSEEVEVECTETPSNHVNINENASNCEISTIENEHTEINKSSEEDNDHNHTILEENMHEDLGENENLVEDIQNLSKDDDETNEDLDNSHIEIEETRKVPKVTLKLPKLTNYNPPDIEEDDYQSEDSEKLTMEVEKESDQEIIEEQNDEVDVDVEETVTTSKTILEVEEEEEEEEIKTESVLPTAGSDIPIIELELEQPLDKFDIKELLMKCLQSTILTCLYCNHARKISVNGKQLGLHAIAEHRYSAIVKSITAEELIPESFNARIMECMETLENVYFNLESTTSEGGVTFSHIFECFQCRFSTSIHKELYLHNRKMHTKAILLCIMCKTSFYSYSELICHLCPGIYVLDHDVKFRCCLCIGDDLPSAFRLMVHLRKKHHVCDVCLEMCHNQSRLSNHVWKHKLHHLCYRCGIAYRNKPDITKHLYWKHGTESVVCKKCMQKKWPHVYHFCIPPTNFQCEECNLSFRRAVSLMVHKRIHREEFPHQCSEEGCVEKFVSKKLLFKHEFKHRQPPEEPVKEEIQVVDVPEPVVEEVKDEPKEETIEQLEKVDIEEKPKPKVDVYDLPELNLSESDSSDSDDEANKIKMDILKSDCNILEEIESHDDLFNLEEHISGDVKENETEKSAQIIENIWDNFKNYQANMAKTILSDVGGEGEDEPCILTDIPAVLTLEEALRDHDYCPPTTDTLKEQDGIPNQQESSADHDYCTSNNKKEGQSSNANEEKPQESSAKNQTSNNLSSTSGSDSDSSSCSCGSNCSCSSNSGSSSSTTDSSESDSSSEEGRRRQQIRREKRRQKKAKVNPNATGANKTIEGNTLINSSTKGDALIEESDLETTETDTDEDFYDTQPQKLASKLIAEKREKLLQMAGIGPYINGSMIDSRPSTPNLPEEAKPKKKSKSKKKKKKRKQELERHRSHIPPISYATVAPITLSIPKSSPSTTPSYNSIPHQDTKLLASQNAIHATDSEINTRASKRRRVPNKFYGYSSDEEAEKANLAQPPLKFKKVDQQVAAKPPLLVPPLTIKTIPSTTPLVQPISIKMSSKPSEMRVQPIRLPFPKRTPLQKPKPVKPPMHEQDSGSDSNSSTSDDETAPKRKEQPALYCYCRCPYDEVSEMIGCDSDDCAIEWFHFECVGIMVPPKGQWYCPDCRKKKQQKRDMLQSQMSS